MRRAAGGLVALAGLAGLGAGAPAAAASPRDCPSGARCLTVTVPLDRSGAVPGTVSLRAAVVASPRRRGTAPPPPPVFALAGGPGQAGRDFAPDFAAELGTRRAGRALVTLDQRGTGRSGLLRCPAFERRLRTSWSTGAGDCARALGSRRSLYTSADSAADLEALRVRLGAGRIALYGVSYGTRVALEYARRYPERVERLILDSPVPADGGDPFSLPTFAALPRVLRTVCGYGCGGAERRPVADVRALAARLRRAPLRVRVREGRRVVRVKVSADDLLGVLVTADLFPPLLQSIPPAVRAALQGRPARLARLRRAAGRLEDPGPPREFSPAVFAATLCEESPTAWDGTATPAERRRQAIAALDARPDAAFDPFDRLAALRAGLLSLCGDWPAPARLPGAAPPLPATPALVLAGELDLRTPLEGARDLAAALPGAALLVERGVGHSVLGADPDGCATSAARAFLRRGRVPRCRRARAAAPARGAPARAARAPRWAR